MWTRAFALAVMLFAASPVFAVQPDEILPDPALESRARELSRELRCMVCQNQSIDDSDAPLARDLRILVRERLKSGDSDRQVLDYLTARYGDFVLLNPRFNWHTALLWVLPALILLCGTGVAFAWLRRQRNAAGEEIADAGRHGLSSDEQKRIAELMKKLS